MPYTFKGWEILIIVGLIVLLFGAKRLPDAARGLGRSLRIFKSETKGLVNDASAEGGAATAATAATDAPPAALPAAEATTTAPQPQAERTET
ncbi:MAG: Sec-independent protein translocase subunit TatA [bacterium]